MEGSSLIAAFPLDQKGQVSHALPFAFIVIAPKNFKQHPGRSHGQDKREGERWILYAFL